VGVSTLEDLAKHDAAILEKREKLRKEGRLVLGFEGDPSKPGDAEAELRSGDAWESVVDAVVSKDRTRSNQDRHSVTSQIVTKIKAYWDDQGLKQEKLRALEEKRLKALAKDTIRLVTNEWKRAVMVSTWKSP
jgi:helicase SWR1